VGMDFSLCPTMAYPLTSSFEATPNLL
jgi:hypothetical protein